MGETAQIIALWRRARARGEQVCLATVVYVEGSSYRKPGARMLVTAGGERTGSVSGGCLEAEISRKAWWLTADGPALQQYQSSFDEDAGGVPWGLGCGGTVWVLLERDPEPVLSAIAAAQEQGEAAVIVTRLAPDAGTLGIVSAQAAAALPHGPEALSAAALEALRERRSVALDADFKPTADLPAWFVEYLAPPPRLHIFGAGDDAQPIARFADELGWRVVVADGRSHLLRPERFPPGVALHLLRYNDAALEPACGLPGGGAAATLIAAAISIPAVTSGVAAGEFAVVLTHSWEQDRALLHALLPARLAYLGVLGPRHRTQRLLEQVAPSLGWLLDRCWVGLHAPVGLDLGARDPAAIALSIVAELQATAAARTVTVQRAETPAPAAPMHADAHG